MNCESISVLEHGCFPCFNCFIVTSWLYESIISRLKCKIILWSITTKVIFFTVEVFLYFSLFKFIISRALSTWHLLVRLFNVCTLASKLIFAYILNSGVVIQAGVLVSLFSIYVTFVSRSALVARLVISGILAVTLSILFSIFVIFVL